MKRNIIIISIIIICTFILLNYSGISNYLTFDNLKIQKDKLMNFTDENYLLTVVIFILIYFISISLSIPQAIILSIIGGFLFGVIRGVIFINIGATPGALISFLLVRSLFGKKIQKKFSHKLEKFNNELERNGNFYLLSIRMIPLFPFVFINILAGLSKVKTTRFLWTTSLGMIPVTIVYAFAGKQLNNINSPGDIISVEILGGLVILALMILLPVVVKHLKKKSVGYRI